MREILFIIGWVFIAGLVVIGWLNAFYPSEVDLWFMLVVAFASAAIVCAVLSFVLGLKD